ncbi:MAG: 3-oxoacyl-ACP reductase FabG [Proteobacteria bacterium]|nr:3-oxoacyl-ACP reductase FabG [Pseudomonadota bacterium]
MFKISPTSPVIAVVTGASRGIGHAIAKGLSKQGVIVAGTATTAEGAAKITESFKENQVNGKGYTLDVRDFERVQAVLNEIQSDFGSVSILVNNAGIHRDNLLLRMREQQWDEVLDTNLSAVFRMSKTCLKSMVKQRQGRIINITSVVGAMGNPGQVNYCAAKAGMIGFTKALALEMAAYGITVNAVAPGFIETDMTNQLSPEQKEWISAKIPMKRSGKVEDIADTVVFLASDQAAYITGQTIHVNGGMYMV